MGNSITQVIPTSFVHASWKPYTLTGHYDFATKTATITDPLNPSTRAVFKQVAATKFSTFKAFADALEDCLGWTGLGAGYKTVTLDNSDTHETLVGVVEKL